MPRALLSVSDKTGIVDLGRGLVAREFELVSTGGTARALSDAGLAVTGVSDLTGFPEMMDGRLKTLHPKIHGGLLARRDHPEDLAAAAAHGIGLIDLVVVNLYPFAETARKAGVTFEELVEQIDIGGPSMVRAAAKNFHDVMVVVDPKGYSEVLRELDQDGGPSLAFRFDLACSAIQHTAFYDMAISSELLRFEVTNGSLERQPDRAEDIPISMSFDLHKLRDLRYGENPHQKGTVRRIFRAVQAVGDPPGQGAVLHEPARSRCGRAHRAQFSEPAAIVVKHTNPCGAATGLSVADAYIHARDADSVAA